MKNTQDSRKDGRRQTADGSREKAAFGRLGVPLASAANCRLPSDVSISPELSAVQAALEMATPQMDIAVSERMKAVALLETCRLTQPELQNLVESIVDAGEQGITVSLRRYVKMERFQAMVIGIVFGLIVGAIVNLVGLAMVLQFLR
jgi:hypothetical protein